MATTSPRIAVTLPPEQYATIRTLAALQGRSMSAVLAELVDTIHPVFSRLIAVMEHARAQEDSVRDNLRAIADEAERVLLPQAESAARDFEAFLRNVDEALEDPRLVTRGSGQNDLSTPPPDSGGESDAV